MNYEIRRAPDGVEIGIKGRMSFSDHAVFREVIAAFVGGPGARVTFDLKELEFIDSSGLGMLIIARDEAKKKQLTFTIDNARADVKRLMDMARFDRFFTIRP